MGSIILHNRHLHQSKVGQVPPWRPSLRSPRSGSAPRRRMWHISPEGFRELRYSCLLSVKTCAEFLGCSVSSIKAWDRGASRVPWSVVRLLRVFRLGDLGALRPEWRGWTINRNGMVSPEGRAYDRGDLAWWSLTCRQAEAWREARSRTGCPALEGQGLARGRGAPVAEPLELVVWSMDPVGEPRVLALPWQHASLPNPLLLATPTPRRGQAERSGAAPGVAACCIVRWQGVTVVVSLDGAMLSNCNQPDFALIAPPRLTGGESPPASFARSSASRSVGGAS